MYFNARSLRNKIDELRIMLLNEEIDIIAITETYIDTNNIDFTHEYQINSYKLYHKDRVGKRGGGVLLYIKENICSLEVQIPSNNSELLCVKINNKDIDINVVVVYRRPTHTYQEDIDLYNNLEKTLSTKETLIIGDFNLPNIHWGDVKGSGHASEKMTEFIKDNFLYQLVQKPTRGDNILDLVITTHENLISDLEVGELISNCDHNIVRLQINMSHTNSTSETFIPNYNMADFNSLRNDLKDINLHLEGLTNIDDTWEKFKEIFMSAQKKHIPMRKRHSKKINKPLWYDINISRAIRERNRLYNLKRETKNNTICKQYLAARRKVKSLIKTAKRNYEISIAKDSKTNPKQFYRYINSSKQIKSGIGPILNTQGVLETDSKDIASTLNNYFSSVFTTAANTNTPQATNQTSNIVLPDFKISQSSVTRQIELLKINKSPGPDLFIPKILKMVKDEVAEPLTKMFNMSLQHGQLPTDWKTANITPIFKKGDKKQPGNYRPISLTSVVVKLLESIIRDELVLFIENNNLINNSQHGFRAKKSCLTNLIEFYDNLFKINDFTKSLDIVYLDFQKAFDKVPHNKLLQKVENLGIQGNTLNWIRNWLSERKQRVIINGVESEWTPVTSGVPQGSVLGPLLFIIYINDLDNGINNIISKFADDTKIGNAIISESDRSSLQSDLNKISEWSENWQMPFNVNKCLILQIGSRNNKYEYHMNGEKIKSVSQIKDLGVLINENLKSTSQCTAASNKANRALGFIKRNFHCHSKDIVVPLYKSIVRPHLEYAVQFWSPYLKKDIEKLESVQRRATKLIPSLRNKPYNERLRELDLFSLKKRRIRGQLIECFKILKGFSNVNSNNLFKIAKEGSTRGNKLKLTGRKANLDITKNFFTHSIINEWNKLPNEVIDSDSIYTFKKRLDTYHRKVGLQ